MFTLVAALMIMTILSMALFQTQISSPAYEDTTSRMSLDELHYYVEALKKDTERAIAISSQRAATYATNHAINTNETFRNYGMKNCTQFTYYTNGSEAAIAELMVCGRLANAKMDAQDVEKYMEDNTVEGWMQKIYTNPPGEVPYNVSMRLRNMSMALYDSWHYIIFSDVDITVVDESNNNRYSGQGIPISSVVDFSSAEDPMYSVRFGIPQAIRQYNRCEMRRPVNGTTLDGWIDEGCYNSVKPDYNAPSFFDRLEGRNNLSTASLSRYSNALKSLNYSLTDIGLESMANLDLLDRYNVTVNYNLTQVDYLYWSGQRSACSVEGMSAHPNFRIDFDHAREYGIEGLNCEVYVKQATAGSDFDYFEPTRIDNLPAGTKLTWVEATGTITHTLHWNSKTGQGEGVLEPSSRLTWLFNQTGEYVVTSTPSTGSYGVFYLQVT
ncbi:MAG: hypothetical protein V1875_01785 [Candidatus Altiarchaeota archaeon]